jgi:hypothetical protein
MLMFVRTLAVVTHMTALSCISCILLIAFGIVEAVLLGDYSRS